MYKMSNINNNDLIGQLYAEAIDDVENIIKSYISCNEIL